MIPLLLAYAFTLPSECSARYLVDYLTTSPPANGAICAVAGPALYTCRYWTDPSPISCEKYAREDPPPGQVWMRLE